MAASAGVCHALPASAPFWPLLPQYNADLASNWRRITCTPLEGARITCQNKWSPSNFALVFDADCGAAGPATIQVRLPP